MLAATLPEDIKAGTMSPVNYDKDPARARTAADARL